jgi:hypothetical protein
MDSRMAANFVMRLPMSRRDIADYLGLKIETVPRELPKLRTAGVLKFVSKTQREIVVRSRTRLASFDPCGKSLSISRIRSGRRKQHMQKQRRRVVAHGPQRPPILVCVSNPASFHKMGSSIIVLELANEGAALRAARIIARETGRCVTVRYADMAIIETIPAACTH